MAMGRCDGFRKAAYATGGRTAGPGAAKMDKPMIRFVFPPSFPSANGVVYA
jgi:hypothetical protein